MKQIFAVLGIALMLILSAMAGPMLFIAVCFCIAVGFISVQIEEPELRRQWRKDMGYDKEDI